MYLERTVDVLCINPAPEAQNGLGGFFLVGHRFPLDLRFGV